MDILIKLIFVAVGVALKLTAGGMDNFWLQLLFLVIGFVLLIKGADWFVDGASGVADRMGISQLIIGLTVVAFGTSAPEAAVSITAATRGQGVDIAISNVLGSNIMNILLILGLAALLCPLPVQRSTRKMEIPSVILVTALVLFLGHFDHTLGHLDGAILLVCMAGFLAYTIVMAKKGKAEAEEEDEKKSSVPMLLLDILVGIIAIVMGSDVTVGSASYIALHLGMSEKLVGLTIVAFGTSLPELITSCIASIKKKPDIAVGNIVGSNLFNILFVLAMSAAITPLPYVNAATGADFLVDNIVAIGAAAMLWVCVIAGKEKIRRWGGVLMLASYAGYFFYLMKGI